LSPGDIFVARADEPYETEALAALQMLQINLNTPQA